MGRGRNKQQGYSDQYGEVGVSQDREMHSIGRQGTNSGTGGGSAGRTSTKGAVTYTRQLPKFLQKHAHLLAKAPAEAEEGVTQPEDDGGDDDDDQHDVVWQHASHGCHYGSRQVNPDCCLSSLGV